MAIPTPTPDVVAAAQSSAAGGGSIVWIVGVIAVLVVLGGLGLYLRRRSPQP